jgi:hypothetical protein
MDLEEGETTEEDRMEDPDTYDLEIQNANAKESSHSPGTSPQALQDERDQDMADSQEKKSETHSELTARAELLLAK